VITLTTDILEQAKQPTLSNKYTNWNKFKRLVESNLAAEQFNHAIQQAAGSSSPSIMQGKEIAQDRPIIIEKRSLKRGRSEDNGKKEHQKTKDYLREQYNNLKNY
jgi:hypothetical protein